MSTVPTSNTNEPNIASGINVLSRVKTYSGYLVRFKHLSLITKTEMTCSVFLPLKVCPTPESVHNGQADEKCPIILYLSGLTCTDENVCIKSGVFKELSEFGIGFVAPDTSPRGANIPGEADSWDFGVGAGFYVDATQDPWSKNYLMYSYIIRELPSIISANFPGLDLNRMSITGHSMGGHGALTIALKNQNMFRSVSAFAPITNPINCPWGIKALSNYLGESNMETWKEYDTCELLKSYQKSKYDDILIDVGSNDPFLITQLNINNLQQVCNNIHQNITIRVQEGYDHSYYFVSTFIHDHIKFHAERLNE